MTYARMQDSCETKFDHIVKESSLRQADADDVRGDGDDGSRQLAAIHSTIRAQVYAMEYAALEAHKRAPAHGKDLTPQAENAFRELGYKLDEFIVPGQEGIGQRRAALIHALDNPAPGQPGNARFNFPADYEAMASAINEGVPPALHRSPWQAEELAHAAGEVHKAIGLEGESAHPVFKSQHARAFLEAMGDRQDRGEEIERLNGIIATGPQEPVLEYLPLVLEARSNARNMEALDFIEPDGYASDDSGMSLGSEASEQTFEPRLEARDRSRGGREL